MKEYIFITAEGFTYQPNSESTEPDIENCQVVGYGQGGDAHEAFKAMLQESSYLLDTTFDEVIGMEVNEQKKEHFYLSKFRDKIL